MQMFYIQSILNQAVPTDSYNILAKNRKVTIRRSYSGELAKLYTEDDINSDLHANPITTDNLGQFKFYAPDGKYKAYDINNNLLAEFVLQDPFMTEVEQVLTSFSVTGLQHNHHFNCLADTTVTVTVNAPTMDSPTDFQKGILIYFTQIGEGTVKLVEGSGINFIYDDATSLPQTAAKGATIGMISRNETDWVIVGRLGY